MRFFEIRNTRNRAWVQLSISAMFISAIVAADPQTETALQQAERAVQRAKDTGLLSDELIRKAQQVDPNVIADVTRLSQSTALQTEMRETAAADLGWEMADLDQDDSQLSERVAQKEHLLAGNSAEPDAAILITLNMPEKTLREVFTISETQGVPLYLNGLAKGTINIPQTLKVLQNLAKKFNVTPNIYINPIPFEDLNVTSVPAMIVRDGDQKGVIYGLLDIDYAKLALKRSVGDNEWEDLGTHGPTFTVAELSLVDEMKQRLATVDWKSKQQKAISTYWSKHKFNRLVRAEETKQWFIDPTIRVKQDIKNSEGVVLARAGEVLNPVQRLGLSMSYVVIDGTDPQQIAWAKKAIGGISGRFQIMISELKIDKGGWDNLSELRKSLGAPIFILPSEAIERFSISKVPVLITTTNDGYFSVLQQALDVTGRPIPVSVTESNGDSL